MQDYTQIILSLVNISLTPSSIQESCSTYPDTTVELVEAVVDLTSLGHVQNLATCETIGATQEPRVKYSSKL